VPYTKNVALIIDGLNRFVKRCDEFREPKNAIITEIEINLVLDVANRKYKMVDIIAPIKPLKIVLLNNSHFYYNCECGFTDQGENSEAILLYIIRIKRKFMIGYLFLHMSWTCTAFSINR